MLACGFPFQIGVAGGGERDACVSLVARAAQVVSAVARVVDIRGVGGIEGGNVRVTVLSPRVAELQVGEDFVFREKVFLRGTPCQRESGEHARAVFLSKARVGVAAHRYGGEVTVGVVIVGLCEHREYAPLRLAAAVVARARAATDLHVAFVFGGISLARCRQVAEGVADGFGAEQQHEVVLVGKGFIVVGSVGPCPCVALSVDARHAVHVAGVNGASVSVVEILAVFHADVRLNGESLHRFHLDKGVAQNAPGSQVVVLGILELLHGVRKVGADEFLGPHPVAVGAAHGQCGVLAHGRERNAAVARHGCAAVFPVRHEQVLAHAQVAVKVVGRVEARRVAVVESFLNRALIVDIVGREEHGAFIRTIGDRGREVVRQARLIHQVLPVGVCCGIVGVACHVGLQHGAVAVAVERMGGRDVRVFRSLPVSLSPLLGIEHVVAFGHGLCAQRVVHVHRHAFALAVLGGDDYHAARSSRTVDRSRGGVFEHLHGLDVARVDAIDIVGRHAVHDVERVVA